MQPSHEIAKRRLMLAPLDPSYAEGDYIGWLRDPEVTRFLEARLIDYDVPRLRQYIVTENERSNAVLFGMFLRQDRRLVGTIKLSEIREVHRNCNMGLMIGDKTLWGQGYGAEAIEGVTSYAFNTLRMHKILAGCYSDNIGSARAFLKAGYIIEGRLSDDRWNGAAFVDRILLGKVNPVEVCVTK
jgi:RimJ/RimL family protein N-acetyltransferase